MLYIGTKHHYYETLVEVLCGFDVVHLDDARQRSIGGWPSAATNLAGGFEVQFEMIIAAVIVAV